MFNIAASPSYAQVNRSKCNKVLIMTILSNRFCTYMVQIQIQRVLTSTQEVRIEYVVRECYRLLKAYGRSAFSTSLSGCNKRNCTL
jgi:hypothetical protein